MITDNLLIEGLNPVILDQKIKYNQEFNVSLSTVMIGHIIKGLIPPDEALHSEEFQIFSQLVDAYYFNDGQQLIPLGNIRRAEFEFIINSLRLRITQLETDLLNDVNIIGIKEFVTLGIVLRHLECVSQGILSCN